MKLSQTEKNSALTDILTLQDPDVEDGVVFVDPGLTTHKSAKRQAESGGVYDSLFEAFERTWGAIQSYEAMSDPKSEVILEMGCAEMPVYNAFKMMRLFPKQVFQL